MEEYKMDKQEEIELRRMHEWSEDINGKTCKTCQWSNYAKGDTMTTCGHHIQNFSINSGCGAWTSPNDKDYLEQRDKKRAELKKKISGGKEIGTENSKLPIQNVSTSVCHQLDCAINEDSVCKHGIAFCYDRQTEC